MSYEKIIMIDHVRHGCIFVIFSLSLLFVSSLFKFWLLDKNRTYLRIWFLQCFSRPQNKVSRLKVFVENCWKTPEYYLIILNAPMEHKGSPFVITVVTLDFYHPRLRQIFWVAFLGSSKLTLSKVRSSNSRLRIIAGSKRLTLNCSPSSFCV